MRRTQSYAYKLVAVIDSCVYILYIYIPWKSPFGWWETYKKWSFVNQPVKNRSWFFSRGTHRHQVRSYPSPVRFFFSKTMLKGTNIPWVSELFLGDLMRCRGIFPWDFRIFFNEMSPSFKSFEIIFQQFQLKTSGILLDMIPSWEVTYRILRHFWKWI